jgi:hypothetical protein
VKAAIGPALIRAKHVAIEYLNKDRSEAARGVDPLRRELEEIARQTDCRTMRQYMKAGSLPLWIGFKMQNARLAQMTE